MHRLFDALIVVVGVLGVGVGCSKQQADECQRVIDKSKNALSEISRLRGKELSADDRKLLVEQCRKSLKAGKREPSVDCVLAAKDDAHVRDCYMKGFESYIERSKSTEAKLQLNRIGKAAKVAFIEKAAYPAGKVGPTPATPCCQQPGKQCAPVAADWAVPVWQALELQIDEPFRFQYSYESDGKTFTATAVGDLACDGNLTTHTATGTVTADGNPQVSQQ
ncbi:MAG: hypothetical protein H0T89_08400 [Deltaproteobacteria bacterium]|nr:hypothetical protein [Deltaproteobacteria bacterium]MDQ3299199.1 hypothetical protein [Myxococcota bacterium]